MEPQFNQDEIKFNLPKNQSSVIKVLGVGGGGSNAVNYMFKDGAIGVDFVVTNTDSQHLENCAVPNKIQLGVSLTEGLGAGANPEVGEKAAQESIEEVKSLLQHNTKMVFITAGMGGGTGTGAAPVIAKAAMDMGILTVGIVTVPFSFEGKSREQQAQKGLEKLRENVDALVVINNNKLREVYGNLGYKAGFSKADEVLATAARGIAEVITHHYTANIDLRDAKTVLANSGTAIMGSATANGENRAVDAIINALDSPLLNDNHIRGAKHVLLLIVSGEEEITIDEIGEINEHIQKEAGGSANIIMGIGDDASLENEIGVTVIATGFNAEQEVQVLGEEPGKIIHPLTEDQPVSTALYSKQLKVEEEDSDDFINKALEAAERKKIEQIEQQNQPDLFAQQPYDLETPVSETVDSAEESSAIEQSIEEEDAPMFTVDFNDTPAKEEPSKTVLESANSSAPAQSERKEYSLDEYLELEEGLIASKPPVAKKEEEEVTDEELKFSIKKVEEKSEEKPSGEVNPLNSTISESKMLKVGQRREKLRAFNYRFRNQNNNIEEAENEPAYKRQGINLQDSKLSQESSQSRYSVNKGADDDVSLKSNNSFLHDNVD